MPTIKSSAALASCRGTEPEKIRMNTDSSKPLNKPMTKRMIDLIMIAKENCFSEKACLKCALRTIRLAMIPKTPNMPMNDAVPSI